MTSEEKSCVKSQARIELEILTGHKQEKYATIPPKKQNTAGDTGYTQPSKKRSKPSRLKPKRSPVIPTMEGRRVMETFNYI